MRVPALRSSSVVRFNSKTPKRRSSCVALTVGLHLNCCAGLYIGNA